MFLAIMFLAVLVIIAVAGMWSMYWYVVLPGMKEEPWRLPAPEYHYRHCRTCDYTYLVSSEHTGPDPGCSACGAPSWVTETTGLLHRYIRGKWQDIPEPPRLLSHPEIAAMRATDRSTYLRSLDQPMYKEAIKQVKTHTASIRAQVHRGPVRITPVPPELDHISRHSALYEPTLEADD